MVAQKGGVNRHFQAKLSKYYHLHIIETTASIPNKFCTTVKTTKYTSWTVPKRIQNFRTAVIFGKIDKFPYLSNGLTDCREIWYGDTFSLLTALAIKNYNF